MAKYTFRDIVVDSRTGLNPRQNFKLGCGDNYYITIKDIHNGRIEITDKTNRIDDKAVDKIKKRSRIKNGDILFTSIGRIGETAIVHDKDDTWEVNESIFIFTINHKIIEAEYFCILLQSTELQERLAKDSSGSTFKSIKMNQLEKLTFNIPPLEEQQRISVNIKKAYYLINLCNQIIEKLDLLVKARFVEMFGDPVYNTKKWRTEVLSNHLNVVGGYAFKSDLFQKTGIPVIRIGNINAGYFRPVNMVFWEDDGQLERYKMYAGDLVMSLTGTVGKDDYGNVCILGNDYDVYYLNQRNAKLELFSSLDKYYLSELLKFEEIKKKLTGISRGVRQANISNKDILNLCVPVPPLELQQKYADFVEHIEKLKSAVKKTLEKAEILKKSLMQEYFK